MLSGRVVDVEWDRSHESFTAVMRAESESGVIVSLVSELSVLSGLRWIRGSEIVSVEEEPLDSPVVRLASHRGDLAIGVDTSLTDLETLLGLLTGLALPIGVYCERTGSGELLVGSNARASGGRLVLDEIDPSGAVTGDELTFDLDEIISIEWGTTYLDDLAELAELTAEGTGDASSLS